MNFPAMSQPASQVGGVDVEHVLQVCEEVGKLRHQLRDVQLRAERDIEELRGNLQTTCVELDLVRMELEHRDTEDTRKALQVNEVAQAMKEREEEFRKLREELQQQS